jgi:alkylated DNA nucleotide flippase Atl1
VDQEEYVEAVLAVVEQVPPGRVTTYGAVAAAVGRGGPRQVGRVMATYGGGVPWWRVIRADGTLPECHSGEALELHRSEGTALLASGRVDMRSAFWEPGSAPAP